MQMMQNYKGMIYLEVDSIYDDAVLKYDLALQLVADVPSSDELRSACYLNRATCFFKMGKYEDSIKECTKALELNSSYKKALLRRAEGHEKLEHYEEAVADLTKLLEMEPSNNEVKRSAVRLRQLAREKREKIKEEMIGKLKDVGNSILWKFGMSVENQGRAPILSHTSLRFALIYLFGDDVVRLLQTIKVYNRSIHLGNILCFAVARNY